MSFSSRRVHDSEEQPSHSHGKKWANVARMVLSVSGPLCKWYITHRQKEEERERDRRILHTVQKFFIAAIAIALALLIGTIVLRSVSSISLPSSFSLGEKTATIPTDTQGRTNILLLGEGDETGEYLLDSIIVASIDEATESIGLLSLPRDLYFLKTESMGEGRLNSLYRDYFYELTAHGKSKEEAEEEGMKQLAKEIGAALDMNIHHTIKVNFEGFVQAVDAIGGVTVYVPYDIVDPEYPGPNYTYELFEIRQGTHHFDGETALKYARSRHSTSDFSRSERQQMLLQALGKKVKEEGLLRKPHVLLSLFQNFQEHVYTTMSIPELVALAVKGRSINTDTIFAMQLSDRNGLYGDVLEPGGLLYTPPRDLFDGASVLLPVSIPEFPVTWKQIHTLSQLFFGIRTLHLQTPSIAILNAGAPPGSAGKLSSELKKFGIPITDVRNAAEKQEDSILLTPGELAAGSVLATVLHLPLQEEPTGPQDITIVLGKNYQHSRLQDLLSSMQ
ncbi:hypothetical protein COW95_02570 [Candidatus Peregrinibacteria bacterium CG22_combo_CG10-13_8_21_14_all_49_11]|nr:MAG: hypothetical protein COW95_02570 [Candidatus Peregrinibacteria bacterium CG22_combo_CG10-13_8_21_14_all_49_11]